MPSFPLKCKIVSDDPRGSSLTFPRVGSHFVRFDTTAFREILIETLARKIPVSRSMAIVLDPLRHLAPEKDWSPVRTLPYDDEVAELGKVLNRILTECSPPETVQGFIFGAQELFDGDRTEIALQLVSAERIDADDPSFGQNRYDLRYEPPIAISSDILGDLHNFATTLDPDIDALNLEAALEASDDLELSLIADHLLLWSYASLAVAHACELTEPALWLGSAPSRKVYVGHGEDYLRLGFIEPTGFRRDPLMD